MIKKVLCLLLCVGIFAFAGCKNDKETKKTTETTATTTATEPTTQPKKVTYTNPLTGEDGLSKKVSEQRPVAIMVNNLSLAQNIQTGVNKADIVYETEVEGGITRLIAVFQDFKSVKQVGSIRSSRYVYIDIAAGHNAIYAYHGIDTKYAQPHLNIVDSIQVDTNNGAARISNGLDYEHTLYVYPDKVWNSIKSSGIKTTVAKAKSWQKFAPANKLVKLESKAKTITVPFSYSYNTTFKYDASAKKYVRFFNDEERKDYNTGKSTKVKNVFVLLTSIQDYPDGYHRNVALSTGSGYYFVNGTYAEINWSKGDSNNGFEFTDKNGKALKVNPGNSWVCIADGSTSMPIID